MPSINFNIAYYSVFGIIIINFTIILYPLFVRRSLSPVYCFVFHNSCLMLAEIDSQNMQQNYIKINIQDLHSCVVQNINTCLISQVFLSKIDCNSQRCVLCVLALLFFNLGARWGWMVNATPWLLYSQERHGTHCIQVWVGPSAGLDGCKKSCPHWDLYPGPSGPQRVTILTEPSIPMTTDSCLLNAICKKRTQRKRFT